MLNRPSPNPNREAQPAALGTVSLQRRRASIAGRLWDGWVRLTGPHWSNFSKEISAQERLRRSRLISALLLLIVATIALLIPTLYVQPLIWRPVVLLAGGSVLVVLLNRWGQITLSGLAYVVMVDVALAGFIITKPIFTYSNIPNLDLFILALLISGIVLPRRLIPVVAALHIGLILAIFNLKQHDDLLAQGIQRYFGGQSYTAYINAILLQVCGAGIAWLHAWSVERALLRASRAEELAQAQLRIEEQSRLLADQKARLEHGVLMLQEVQERIANGDLEARVSLYENDLLPLAVNFNLLAERLGRVERIAQEHRRLEHALAQALEAASISTVGKDGAALPQTGTLADRVAPLLLHRRRVLEHLHEGGKQAEDLAVVLQRQQEQLHRMETTLRSARSLTGQVAHAAAQQQLRTSGPIISGPVESPGAGGLGGSATRREDQPAPPGSLRALLEQEQLLLEEASKMTVQSRELAARCAKGAHLLSQRLLEVR
ncbi:MAG TPA: hypothetical protein VH540_25955 [Ktedonobacterales bacterium]|jgi:hypothetical protein